MAAILEAANDARSLVSDEVVAIANSLSRMSLFPDDVAAVLDGLREGLLKHGHIKLHQEIAEELATLADWLSKEQA